MNSYLIITENNSECDSLTSRQWWSLLKSFIFPTSQSFSPQLEKDGLVFVEEKEKANVLRDQTLLNDHDAVLPEMVPILLNVVFTRWG